MVSTETFEKEYYGILKKKYWSKHNCCCYFTAILESFLENIFEEKLDRTEVIFGEDVDIFEDDDCLEMLKRMEKEEELLTIISKNMSIALLVDFLDHINEVLGCLKFNKIALAYELMRKPFKENLLYLEWLNYNPTEICTLSYNNEIHKCAIGKGGINRDNIKDIVVYNTMNNRLYNKMMTEYLSSDDLYNIRYDYNSLNSMELTWNKAIHLVTTAKNIKSNDFNFIYCNSELTDKHLDCIYSKLPSLLMYTIGVFENIYTTYFKKLSHSSILYNDYLIAEHFLESNKEYNTKIPFGNIFKNKTYLICNGCKKVIEADSITENRYFNYNWYLCQECGDAIKMHRYYFIE